jgi:metallo-beta-lactamase class B
LRYTAVSMRIRVAFLVFWAMAAVWAAEDNLPTLQDLFRKNVGTPEQTSNQFPPHKIIANIYFVGAESLASYLITTPEGHILINSSYERSVPVIRKSVEDLGFKFTDIKILLGSHAHGDHMEGDAMVKELSGARVMAMAEDVPLLEKMMPGGKPHPIDRVLHDGDEVTLGGVTLTARLTPGHTPGNTTWTMKVRDGGKDYNVLVLGSIGVNPGMILVNNKNYPSIAEDYMKSYKVLRALPCEIFLGSHGAFYDMTGKFAKLKPGEPNPFVDPKGYKAFLDLNERLFYRELAEQKIKAGE